jgi:hypothetical protein
MGGNPSAWNTLAKIGNPVYGIGGCQNIYAKIALPRVLRERSMIQHKQLVTVVDRLQVYIGLSERATVSGKE